MTPGKIGPKVVSDRFGLAHGHLDGLRSLPSGSLAASQAQPAHLPSIAPR